MKRIVEAHDGSCGVRCTPGSGCVFWFELPRVQESEGLSLVAASV